MALQGQIGLMAREAPHLATHREAEAAMVREVDLVLVGLVHEEEWDQGADTGQEVAWDLVHTEVVPKVCVEAHMEEDQCQEGLRVLRSRHHLDTG